MKKALEFFVKKSRPHNHYRGRYHRRRALDGQKQDAKTKAIEEKEPKHELGKLNPQTPVDTTKVQQRLISINDRSRRRTAACRKKGRRCRSRHRYR